MVGSKQGHCQRGKQGVGRVAQSGVTHNLTHVDGGCEREGELKRISRWKFENREQLQ